MSITNTNKHDNDFWYTPEPIRNEFIKLIPETVKTVTDPCAGAADLCDFNKFNYKLYDLNPRKDGVMELDFFNLRERQECIAMNPPFSMGRQFIEHALELSDTVIVICPFSCVKPFKQYITDVSAENWYKSAFYITFPLGIFRLERKTNSNGFTFGFQSNKWDYLFENKRPGEDWVQIKDLEKFNKNETRKGIILYPSLLGTYHDWNWVDERTGYLGWVAIHDQKSHACYSTYQGNCKGHKAGEERDYVWFIPTEEPEELYEYFRTSYPTNNWYRVRGIQNGHLWVPLSINGSYRKDWDTEHKSTEILKKFGEGVLNEK